ncbi:MAG: universal stress protein [Dehalococcoidia bacterium]|nr:universal stress protein [Dehalococcoidia bacterium]
MRGRKPHISCRRTIWSHPEGAQYNRFLLTTDGSELARLALKHISQVLAPGGSVTVVEVISASQILAKTTSAGFEYGGDAILGGDLVDAMIGTKRADAETELAAIKKELEQMGVAHIETVILQSIPGDAIVDEAQNQKAEIVLMSMHGCSGFRRTVLGSVADHVLRHLDGIPVLLVHPHTK